MSKILALTGVTGMKSGGAFAEQLSENRDILREKFPDGIRALMRETSNAERLEKQIPNVEIRRGDFTDVEFLKSSLLGVDTLLHIAGIHSSREIVEAAAANGVRRLILVHTTGIYSKYKAAGEEYRKTDEFVYDVCRKNHILLTILRPTMIYGNDRDNNVITFIKMVDRLPVMPVVSGAKYELQPVHYRDLGKAYYQVLLHESETANRDFILSGKEPIPLRKMLLEIGKNLGKKVHFVSVPFPIAYTGAVILYWVTFRKKDYREKVQRLCEPRVFSHEEAANAFGYEPMAFEEGISGEVKEYKERK